MKNMKNEFVLWFGQKAKDICRATGVTE